MNESRKIVKKYAIFIILLSLFFHIPQVVSGLPILDGKILENEWKRGQTRSIKMTNGEILRLTTLFSNTDMYFLATTEHNPPNVIILDVAVPHDYFGIEFDNNKDEVIMGTFDSPDDTIMIDYIVPGAVDMYSHTFKVFEDERNAGTNDVQGASGSNEGLIIWELKKPLTSYDTNGYDISLKTGDEYRIMIAIWDDKPAHSAAAYVNTREGNTNFIAFTVGSPVNTLSREYIGGIVLIFSLILSVGVIKFGVSKKIKLNKN